jgi:hypothetical protein
VQPPFPSVGHLIPVLVQGEKETNRVGEDPAVPPNRVSGSKSGISWRCIGVEEKGRPALLPVAEGPLAWTTGVL